MQRDYEAEYNAFMDETSCWSKDEERGKLMFETAAQLAHQKWVTKLKPPCWCG
jgi:hypothetical protein